MKLFIQTPENYQVMPVRLWRMVTISVTSNVVDEDSVPSEMKNYYRRHFGNYFTMHKGEHVST
jgi:hypothetical protein